jgi:hypothetical protein
MWAVATLGERGGVHLAPLAEAAARGAHVLLPGDAANALWAAGELGVPRESGLLEPLLRAAAGGGGGGAPMEPIHADLCIRAMVKLAAPDEALLRACVRALGVGAGALAAGTAARALHAAVALGAGADPALLPLLAAVAKAAPALASPVDAADAAWAVAALPQPPPSALTAALAAALERTSGGLTRETAETLAHAAGGGFPLGPAAAAAVARLLSDAPPPPPPAELGALRASIAAAANTLGCDAETGVPLPGASARVVDVVVTMPGRRGVVAVVVDGPRAFFAAPPGSGAPVGPSKPAHAALRAAALRAAGFHRVLRVAHFQWKDAPDAGRVALLGAGLRDVSAAPAPAPRVEGESAPTAGAPLQHQQRHHYERGGADRARRG